jgi:hypothetical protein
MNPNDQDPLSKEDQAALKVIEAIEAEKNDEVLFQSDAEQPNYAAVPTIDEVQSEAPIEQYDALSARYDELVSEPTDLGEEIPGEAIAESDPAVATVLTEEPEPLADAPVAKKKRSFKKPIIVSVILIIIGGVAYAGYEYSKTLEFGEPATTYTDLTGGDAPGGNGAPNNSVNVQTFVQNNTKEK